MEKGVENESDEYKKMYAPDIAPYSLIPLKQGKK